MSFDDFFPKYVGCVAYLDCGLELAGQLDDLGITENVHIFGVSGRSIAGLMLTARNLGLDWRATGIAVNYDTDMQEYLYDVINGAEKELDLPVSFQPSDMRVLDQYVGEGYGIPTEGVIEAVHMLGRLEGLMIDPNYTGTVMSALIDQIRQGNLSNDETWFSSAYAGTGLRRRSSIRPRIFRNRSLDTATSAS